MSVQYHLGRFPPENLDWPRLSPLISPANAVIARRGGVVHGIPKGRVVEKIRSRYAVRALDRVFSRPIFRSSDFAARADIREPSTRRLLRLMRNGGLLRELRPGSVRRAALLAFPELLNICEGREAF